MALHGTGRRINEAVFVCEAWYVEQAKEGADLAVAPRHHPQRKEAIAVMGRDAKRTRLTHMLQPFHRDEHNQPVFDEVAMAEYNIPADKGPQVVGLIDHLFAPRV